MSIKAVANQQGPKNFLTASKMVSFFTAFYTIFDAARRFFGLYFVTALTSKFYISTHDSQMLHTYGEK